MKKARNIPLFIAVAALLCAAGAGGVYAIEQEQTLVPSDEATVYSDVESVHLPGCEKEGYAFIGWNTEKDGSGDMYYAGDLFAVEGSVDLYGVWESLRAGNDVALDISQAIGFSAEEEPDAEGYVLRMKGDIPEAFMLWLDSEEFCISTQGETLPDDFRYDAEKDTLTISDARLSGVSVIALAMLPNRG